ncbi:hypothetical protein [Escherichia phage IMM-001]|nr:hypothetical protein [Escherichia phage IMM-001]
MRWQNLNFHLRRFLTLNFQLSFSWLMVKMLK